MKKKEWLNATNGERAEYLLGAELEVKRRTGIDPESKVGDANCVVVFGVFAGIIQISNWQKTQQLAMGEAITSLNEWKKELEK